MVKPASLPVFHFHRVSYF